MIIYVTFDHFRSRFGSNKHDFSLKSNVQIKLSLLNNQQSTFMNTVKMQKCVSFDAVIKQRDMVHHSHFFSSGFPFVVEFSSN